MMLKLTTRADFLRLSAGRKAAMPGLVLQMRETPPVLAPSTPALRVGFTVTRKVGNAVLRNRAKRRLRALARAILPQAGRPAHDYVLVGRKETIDRPFPLLIADLNAALDRVHAARAQPRRGTRPSESGGRT